ncbi:hypothetical protein THRCLA_23318, partial [Thraustotheca clavata]
MDDRRPAAPRQLGVQLSLVILVFIVQFLVLQYWFSSDQELKSLREEKLDNVMSTHEPFVRAAVMYLPPAQADKFITQLRWFRQSWLTMHEYEPELWRTDIVVFTSTSLIELKELGCVENPRSNVQEPNKCIVIADYKKASFPEFNYDFADSINVAAVNHPWVEIYDWVLRTDIDTFLTPAFATWKPSTMAVGFGQYSFDGYDTNDRLARIMKDLDMQPAELDNIGSTWYGARQLVQSCANMTMEMMLYLNKNEFTQEEKNAEYGAKGWPRWH